MSLFRSSHCAVELRNVTTFSNYGRKLLDNLNLSVGVNNKVCIAALNKEEQISLTEILTGLKNPAQGSLKIFDKDTQKTAFNKIRKQSYLLQQDPWVFKGSILDNIVYGSPHKLGKRLDTAVELSGVSEIAKNLGASLATQILDPNDQLTLCERRQIALARALLRNPPILILDEPIAGLNQTQESTIFDALIRAAENRTVIAFCRRMKIARNADEVFVLDKGKASPYSGQAQNWPGGKEPGRLWVNTKPEQQTDPTHQQGSFSVSPQPFGVVRNQEILPGYTTTGLASRSAEIETWIAWSRKDVGPVRIKLPRYKPASNEIQKRLLAEYESLRKLKHNGLTLAFDANLGVKMPYTMYEFFDTKTLGELIRKRCESINMKTLITAGRDLASTMSYVHSEGLVNLDINGNYVHKRKDAWIITDCSQIQKEGSVIDKLGGTDLFFRAPENREGAKASYAMDVFSLGRLLYKIAASINPTNNNNGLVSLSVEDVFVDAPDGLGKLVQSMLAEDPSERPTMEQVEWHLAHSPS